MKKKEKKRVRLSEKRLWQFATEFNSLPQIKALGGGSPEYVVPAFLLFVGNRIKSL